MPFLPNTDSDRKEMLNEIGVGSFEELISGIPEEIRLRKKLDLLPKLSEFEVIKLLDEYAGKNQSAGNNICFQGGGAYDHFVPSLIGMVTDRSEFKTAYTPYQAEVSQGTLQAMYEFQSMICALTGMGVANASLYDGATALAEACQLAHAHNRKNEFLIAGTLNPNYRMVIETAGAGRKLEFKTFIAEDGTCDLEGLAAAINDKTSAVIVQHPNVYGNLEDVYEIEKIAHSKGSLFIVSVDPMSLGIFEAPGSYNADIVVGEGQPLGIPLSYGGPYLGLFATKQEFVRKIPGRLSGVTVDSDGRKSYVLTLQTREQQIKREKATSNICTNQGLFMLVATVYMAIMGKQGIKEVAEQSFAKAHYFAEKVSQIPGFSLMNKKPFFREFLLLTPVPASKILEDAEKEGILGGIDSTRFKDCKEGLLLAFTEKRTKAEMDTYLNFLRKYSV